MERGHCDETKIHSLIQSHMALRSFGREGSGNGLPMMSSWDDFGCAVIIARVGGDSEPACTC